MNEERNDEAVNDENLRINILEGIFDIFLTWSEENPRYFLEATKKIMQVSGMFPGKVNSMSVVESLYDCGLHSGLGLVYIPFKIYIDGEALSKIIKFSVEYGSWTVKGAMMENGDGTDRVHYFAIDDWTDRENPQWVYTGCEEQTSFTTVNA